MSSRSRLAAAFIAFALLFTTPARAAWQEVSSDHFVIYADASPSWIKGYADRLERYRAALRHLLGRAERKPGAANKLVIYLLNDQAAVEKLCRCDGVAGFYVPRAGGSIAVGFKGFGETKDSWRIPSDAVLFHEYAHHVMRENSGAIYPRWYSEGVAEMLGTVTFGEDGAVIIGRPPMYRGYGITNGPVLPIEKLLDPVKRRFSGEDWNVFYGRSWALTHLLTFDSTRKGQLTAYLRAVNAGKLPLDAAREAFGDLKQLDRAIDDYAGRARFSALRIDPAVVKPGALVIRSLSAGEGAMMAQRIRSDRGVDRRLALDVVEKARPIAARFPGDANVQTWLAEMEYDAGSDDGTIAAADRAIKADARARDAMLYRGLAQMRQAAKSSPADPALIKSARSWIIKANRVDPDAAEPLVAYYDSFANRGENAPPAAKLGLERAFELAPHDGALRFSVARMLLEEGKLRDARMVLLPIASDPHARSDNKAAEIVAAIDRGDTAAAILGRLNEKKQDDPKRPAET